MREKRESEDWRMAPKGLNGIKNKQQRTEMAEKKKQKLF